MKLNTHNRTPKPQNSNIIKVLLLLNTALIYGMFGLLSFACFYYVRSIFGGIFVILIPIALTAIILLHIKDMEKAYVEIKEDVIYVVDYYWGIKKEKHISRSDITSAEICIGYSCKVKGYRFSFGGMRYIVFRNNKKYLFKIIYLPETDEIFKQYLQ